MILTREVEECTDIEKLAKLPGIAGIGALNRMLVPAELSSEADVRVAVSKIQGDLTWVYTFDTAFFENDAARPLTVITLGFSPTRKITAITTASALLLDTRTGYVYATYEVTEKQSTHASLWGSAESADSVRRETEKKAFGKLVEEFERAWPSVYKKYAKPS